MNRFRLIASFALAAACLLAQGQQPQPGGGANTPTPGPGNTPGIGTPGTGTPGQGRNQSPFPDQTQQQRFPEMQRPIFLSGKVVTDDGTPPPEPATIERICGGGSARPEGYTDSKGRFSIELGRNMGMMQDASVSSNDPFNVGTIILKRLAGVEGMTFSMTSAMAPKDAKKSYDKARDQLKKKKVDEAQKELEKAVGIYPKYAVAWYELGMIHQQANRKEDARKADEESLKADRKYVNPYLQMAVMSAADNNWRNR